jgi:hypothetical protein
MPPRNGKCTHAWSGVLQQLERLHTENGAGMYYRASQFLALSLVRGFSAAGLRDQANHQPDEGLEGAVTLAQCVGSASTYPVGLGAPPCRGRVDPSTTELFSAASPVVARWN